MPAAAAVCSFLSPNHDELNKKGESYILELCINDNSSLYPQIYLKVFPLVFNKMKSSEVFLSKKKYHNFLFPLASIGSSVGNCSICIPLK